MTQGVYSRMTESMPLGVRIKKKRSEMGWSQVKASVELGIGLDTLRKLEQGALVPNSKYIPIIERWLILG